MRFAREEASAASQKEHGLHDGRDRLFGEMGVVGLRRFFGSAFLRMKNVGRLHLCKASLVGSAGTES